MSSDVIKLLPDSVANQIAAGEVIQRPASVIKELVENSVDAGATEIKIVIKDAGRTLIQVIDNGVGMTPTDARMAFERHATSKITSAGDIYSLHTMGFRGEALPSIAAVAQIEMRTMRRGDTIGSKLNISESRFENQEPCVTAAGTNLMVKNLFFHMPARRKFLKKDSVELSHILHEFERLALVNTSVEFTLIHNDVVLHQLLPGGLKQRIASLFGKTVAGQLIPVETETPMVRITGFVGNPANAKRRGAPQFLFVNGRNMRHPYFHKAILSCYEQLIAGDTQPSYFVNFEVDPDTIDVNIHPQKHEIKFENEQPIWLILTAAIKQALGKINAAGAIDFDSEVIPDIPIFMPDQGAKVPTISTDDKYNPFEDSDDDLGGVPTTLERKSSIASVGGSGYVPPRTRVQPDWDKLYENFAGRRDSQDEMSRDEDLVERRSVIDNRPSQSDLDIETDEAMRQSIEVSGRYIVTPVREGMMIIDRRLAHIRVLFDKYISMLEQHSLPSQRLLFPESITLSPAQNALMSSVNEVLERLGFEVSFLGDTTWAVNAAPALSSKMNPVAALNDIISDLDSDGNVASDAILKPAALALARSSAIDYNQPMSSEEIDTLIAQLLSCREAAYTPDGRKTFIVLNSSDITKQFD